MNKNKVGHWIISDIVLSIFVCATKLSYKHVSIFYIFSDEIYLTFSEKKVLYGCIPKVITFVILFRPKVICMGKEATCL